MRKPAVVPGVDNNLMPRLHVRPTKHIDTLSEHDGGMLPTARSPSRPQTTAPTDFLRSPNPLIPKGSERTNAPNAKMQGDSMGLGPAGLEGRPGIEAANAQIRKDNPDMTDDKIAHAIKVMNENGSVHSSDALTLGIGTMTDARWQRFDKSMAEVGVLPAGVDPAKACSLDFVSKGVGKA